MIDPREYVYEFDNAEFIIATIDAWKVNDPMNFDIMPLIDVPMPITHFLGSFDYKITKYGQHRVKFVVHNVTDLESGTRLPPIIGGTPTYEAGNATSIEELIWENPLLAVETVATLLENNPVISVLSPRTREQTSFLTGGGDMVQTFTWFERYDPCVVERYPWPAVLNFLVIDRTQY